MPNMAGILIKGEDMEAEHTERRQLYGDEVHTGRTYLQAKESHGLPVNTSGWKR